MTYHGTDTFVLFGRIMNMKWVDLTLLAEHLKLSEDEMTQLLTKDPAEARPSNADNPFFSRDQIRIYNEDFLRTSSLPPASVDLIVTSPPYNVGIDYGEHHDSDDYTQYLEFSRQWLAKAYELAQPDGRLCMNIPLDKNKGGQQSVYADINTIAKQVGWQYQSTIIWNEQNISRRTAWGSWLSASAPYVIAPVEVIVIMYKEQWKKLNSKDRVSDVTRDEFLLWTNGVWSFNGESKKRIGHPAPFPRELPKRCIKLFSFMGDTVLDPFVGSGTTLIEAAQLERDGIGFDLDKDYCKLAQRRLEEQWLQNQPKLL